MDTNDGIEPSVRARLCKFYGEAIVDYAERAGMRVCVLGKNQKYRDASRSIRRLGVDVDSWPAPAAGLFVVDERTVYIKVDSNTTLAHEFGHALDAALGGGVYRSGYDPAIRKAFAGARSFVTPYAASGLDEYFAESVRAFVGVNDPVSPWPAATNARLLAIDPAMHEILSGIFGAIRATLPESAEVAA